MYVGVDGLPHDTPRLQADSPRPGRHSHEPRVLDPAPPLRLHTTTTLSRPTRADERHAPARGCGMRDVTRATTPEREDEQRQPARSGTPRRETTTSEREPTTSTTRK